MAATRDTAVYKRAEIAHELEEIRDVIDDVSPWLTPFYSNAVKTRIDNTKYEWHTDELDAVHDPYGAGSTGDGAGTNNAWADGVFFTPKAITPTVRLQNACQIQRKDFAVTRRARIINKAGQRDELARQVTRKGLELRRDQEITLLANVAAVLDDTVDDSDLTAAFPTLAGLPTWITGVRAVRGGAGAADPTGDGSDVKSDATASIALSESNVLSVVAGIYEESQELPNVFMLDPVSKRNFSSYLFSSSARVATQYQDQGKSPRGGVTVVGAVDVYVTDFAVLDIVPNRFIAPQAVPGTATGTPFDSFIYNTDYCECASFDPMSTDVISKRGDTDDRMVIVDHTLCVRNPKTVGTVADIDNGLPAVA